MLLASESDIWANVSWLVVRVELSMSSHSALIICSVIVFCCIEQKISQYSRYDAYVRRVKFCIARTIASLKQWALHNDLNDVKLISMVMHNLQWLTPDVKSSHITNLWDITSNICLTRLKITITTADPHVYVNEIYSGNDQCRCYTDIVHIWTHICCYPWTIVCVLAPTYTSLHTPLMYLFILSGWCFLVYIKKIFATIYFYLRASQDEAQPAMVSERPNKHIV